MTKQANASAKPKELQPTHKAKVIRDYIAHESSAARNKYIISILNNRPFIEPFQHLLSIKRGSSLSYYTYYINSIKEISNFIINTPVSA